MVYTHTRTHSAHTHTRRPGCGPGSPHARTSLAHIYLKACKRSRAAADADSDGLNRALRSMRMSECVCVCVRYVCATVCTALLPAVCAHVDRNSFVHYLRTASSASRAIRNASYVCVCSDGMARCTCACRANYYAIFQELSDTDCAHNHRCSVIQSTARVSARADDAFPFKRYTTRTHAHTH